MTINLHKYHKKLTKLHMTLIQNIPPIVKLQIYGSEAMLEYRLFSAVNSNIVYKSLSYTIHSNSLISFSAKLIILFVLIVTFSAIELNSR